METLIIFSAKYLFLLSPLLVGWFIYQRWPSDGKDMARFALFSLPLTYVAGLIARTLYYNPRPFFAENFEPLIPHLADNGFPSDHTLLLAGLATVIYFFDKKWSIPLWCIAVVVGIARILAGVHHILDIAASVAIALISGFLVYFVLKRPKKV